MCLGGAASLLALKSFVYGIRAYDPATLVGTALVLAVVAMAATFLPTRRISRIDPATISGQALGTRDDLSS